MHTVCIRGCACKVLGTTPLSNTGEYTQTGGRLRRIEEHLDDTFCLTYGDGVSNIDINQLSVVRIFLVF